MLIFLQVKLLELLILVQCYNSVTNTFQMAFLYFNVFLVQKFESHIAIDYQSCHFRSVIPNDNLQSNYGHCKKDLNLCIYH